MRHRGRRPLLPTARRTPAAPGRRRATVTRRWRRGGARASTLVLASGAVVTAGEIGSQLAGSVLDRPDAADEGAPAHPTTIERGRSGASGDGAEARAPAGKHRETPKTARRTDRPTEPVASPTAEQARQGPAHDRAGPGPTGGAAASPPTPASPTEDDTPARPENEPAPQPESTHDDDTAPSDGSGHGQGGDPPSHDPDPEHPSGGGQGDGAGGPPSGGPDR
jgi:hypothetical protein